MRFLVDRCTGRRLTQWLVAQGHDAVHVADLGSDPGDAALLQRAAAESRVLVTIDSDFGALVFRDAAAHRGLVRLPDVPAERRIEIMQQLLAKHSVEISTGAVITVRGTRVRITTPPADPH
jgi:predicted nuclease of predicted toxin-antitoxin system